MVSRNYKSPSSLVRRRFVLRRRMLMRPSEDELVSLDELQEKIAEFDDYIQSTDVAAMQSASDVHPFFLVLTVVSRALDWSHEEVFGKHVVCLVTKGVEQVIAVIIWQMDDMMMIDMMTGESRSQRQYKLCTVT